MWPGRSYWRWNIRVFLILAVAWVVLSAGDLYFPLLLSELWILFSLALWLALFAGRLTSRAARRLAKPS